MDSVPAEADEQLKKAAEVNFKQVKSSSVFLSILTPDYVDEPIAMMQLGMAVMLDKPLFLMVKKGTEVPETLRLIARKLVEFTDPESLKGAMVELLKDVKEDISE